MISLMNMILEFDMNDKYIVYYLSKTKKIMHRYIAKRLIEEGIRDIVPSHGNIFTALSENGGVLPMKDIARLSGKDKSTITSHIKHLVSCGYIEKSTSKRDKRVTLIKLTSKGESFLNVYTQISKEINDISYIDMTDEEKKYLLLGLKNLYLNFKKTDFDI